MNSYEFPISIDLEASKKPCETIPNHPKIPRSLARGGALRGAPGRHGAAALGDDGATDLRRQDGRWIFLGENPRDFPGKIRQFMGNYGSFVSNLLATQVFLREIYCMFLYFFWGGIRDTIFFPFKSSYIGAMSHPFIAKIIFTIIPVLGQKHQKKVETSSISFNIAIPQLT